MARLFADENFPQPVVEILRDLGHDIESVLSIGLAGIGTPDRKVLDIAIAEKRCVLTFDRQDYRRLHRRKPSHYRILVVSFDPVFEALASRIDLELRSTANLEGKFVRVYRPSK